MRKKNVLMQALLLLAGLLLLFSGYIRDSSNRQLESIEKDDEAPRSKVLLYITTHMPPGHKLFLKHCWPKALQQSKLLSSADVAIFWTQDTEEDPEVDFALKQESMNILQHTFNEQPLVIYNYTNVGYQEGAIAALNEASRNNYFEGYDWVIRLNPDVIIKDDSWMLETMNTDMDAKLLYINCYQLPGLKIQTDFFALKVGDLPSDILANPQNDNAEMAFTKQMESVIANKQHRHIPEARPRVFNICRVDNLNGPVVHYHTENMIFTIEFEGDVCPVFLDRGYLTGDNK